MCVLLVPGGIGNKTSFPQVGVDVIQYRRQCPTIHIRTKIDVRRIERDVSAFKNAQERSGSSWVFWGFIIYFFSVSGQGFKPEVEVLNHPAKTVMSPAFRLGVINELLDRADLS